jgi:hypothetical protein
MAALSRRDYSEILSDLEDFDAYLEKIGIARPHDRLRKMIANIREVEKYRIEGKLLSLNSHPRMAEFVWSLVEGLEFTNIFQGLRDYDPTILKLLLQKVLRGPIQPAHENNTSNEARNIAFELMLGAGLRRAQAEVTLGTQADLIINHAGSSIYIECKRPRSEDGIGQNLKRARRQLRQHFASNRYPKSAAGLIAISISKAINSGSNWFLVDEEAQIGLGLSRDVGRVHQSHRREYDSEDYAKVLGTIYQIFTPVYVRETGVITAAWQTEIFLHTDHLVQLFPVSGDYLKELLGRI